jgi:hypothetical protein
MVRRNTIDGSCLRVRHAHRRNGPLQSIQRAREGRTNRRRVRQADRSPTPAGRERTSFTIPGSYTDRGPKPSPGGNVAWLHAIPDDFAAGTGMNALSETVTAFWWFIPPSRATPTARNAGTGFRAEDQSRDRGEPSLIAGITREVASHYRIDTRRIFVAGLSAGAGRWQSFLAQPIPNSMPRRPAHSAYPTVPLTISPLRSP